VDLIIQYSEVYSFAIIEKDGWINEYERLILLMRREKENSEFEPPLSLRGDADSVRLENDVYSQLGIYTQNEREKNEELCKGQQALIDKLQNAMCEIEGANANQALLIEELEAKLSKQATEFLLERERMEGEIREFKQRLELANENGDRQANELNMLRELTLLKGELRPVESKVENLRKKTFESISGEIERSEEQKGGRLVEELKLMIKSKEQSWNALEARLKYCTCEMGEKEKIDRREDAIDPLEYNWNDASHEDGPLYLRASIVHLKDEIKRLNEELWSSQKKLIGQIEQESSAHKTIAALEEEIATGKERIASLEGEKEFVESESKKLIEELTQEFIESENSSMASSVVIQQLNNKIAELEKVYRDYVENCWCKGTPEDRSSRQFKSTTVVQEEVLYQGDISQRTEEKLVAATPLKEDGKIEQQNSEKQTWQLNRSKSIVASGEKQDILVELSEADILEHKQKPKVSPAPSKIVYKDSKILSQISNASSKTDKSKSKIQRTNTVQAKTPVKGATNTKGTKDLDEIKKVLFEKRTMIEDLDSKISELSKMTKDIDEKNRLIEGLISENSKKDQLISELKKAILEKKVELTKKEGNLIELRKQLIDKETDVKTMRRDIEGRSKDQLEIKRYKIERVEIEDSIKESEKLIAKEREYNQEMFKIKEVSIYELKARIEELDGIISKLRGERDRETKEERGRCEDIIQKKEAIVRAFEADKKRLQEKLKEADNQKGSLMNDLKELEVLKKQVEDKWRLSELDRIKMREQLGARDRRIVELEKLIEKAKQGTAEGKLRIMKAMNIKPLNPRRSRTRLYTLQSSKGNAIL
jgi:chromosome segregation ATPase